MYLLFDVEVVFLFPWAVVMKDLGPLALLEGALFVVILGVGLAYIWRKGDIDWTPIHGRRRVLGELPRGAVVHVPSAAGSATPVSVSVTNAAGAAGAAKAEAR